MHVFTQTITYALILIYAAREYQSQLRQTCYLNMVTIKFLCVIKTKRVLLYQYQCALSMNMNNLVLIWFVHS